MKVAVVGAGTMGHGIAQVSAMGGYEVSLRDVDESILDDAMDSVESNLSEGVRREKVTDEQKEKTLERLTTTTDMEAAVSNAELVIEAVPEDLELKKQVFEEMEVAADPETILASNTSSMPITEILSVLENPGRGIGIHFFNPPHIMDLVEVSVAEQTSDHTRDATLEYVELIEKDPIIVTDSPGFATSRLGVYFALEAIRMVETGVARPDHIDKAMRKGFNHPMGPIELTDHVGLDIRLSVAKNLREQLGERFRPPQSLRRKVRAGNLGKKTGEGYYVWEDGEKVGLSDEWNDGR